MSRLAFNGIIIIVCLLAIITISIILPHEYRKSVKRFHVVVQVIAALLAIALIVFMFSALDYIGTPSVTGEIVEIRTLGSYAGIYDRYKVILVDSHGVIHEFQSLFPVYGHSAEIIDKVAVGDFCEIYGSTLIDAFFYSIGLPNQN